MLDLMSLDIAGYLLLLGSYGYEFLHACAGALRLRDRRCSCRRVLRAIVRPSLAIALGYGLLCAAKLNEKGSSLSFALEL